LIYGNAMLREALAYTDDRANPATDCIPLDVPSAAVRQYAGPLQMVTLDGSAYETAILLALGRRRRDDSGCGTLSFPKPSAMYQASFANT
jgi:hypothetical protein